MKMLLRIVVAILERRSTRSWKFQRMRRYMYFTLSADQGPR
jgi:hypothetical protein